MNRKLKIAPLILTLCSTSVIAEVTLNGFASIRATAADSDNGTTPFSTLKGDGEVSFKDESLFAIQARADLGEGLSATVQLMAEGRNDFDVEARWAYFSYEINDTHRVSAGRFANPIFFQSEYEKVGFAHNFSRLPKAVYVGFDFSTVEGMALDSTFDIGDYTLDTKVLYGNWDGSAFFTQTGKREAFGLKDIISMRGTLSGDWWKIYAGGFISEMDGGDVDTLITDVFSAGGVAAAVSLGATQTDVNTFNKAVTWTGKDGIYWYAGFNIDYNNWIADFEYADYGVKDSVGAGTEVWYAALGYRFDSYVITVHTEDFEQTRDYSFLSSVQHPVLNATGEAIHQAFASGAFDGSGITLRYDFHSNATLKLDYFKGSNARAAVGDYSIWSIGVDLVF